MNNNTKRILLDLGILTFLLVLLHSILTSNIILIFISILVVIMFAVIKRKKEKNIVKYKEQSKKCKYCKSEIDNDAIVCPICKRAQSNSNNPLLLIPICAILFFMGWCVFSNSSPKPVKELLCGLGIRHGEYCILETKYEIEVKIRN